MYPVKRLYTYFSIVLVLLLIVGSIAYGEEVREFTPSVARISSIEGPVTVQRTVDEDWTDATLNLPLMVGDKIYTGVGGRAELQLDDEVVIRLESDAYIHFANLEDTLTRVGVFKGTVAVHADPVSYKRAPVEVQTDSFLAQIRENGKIRFNTRPNGDADILARRGEVLVSVGDQPYQLQRGDQLHVNNDPPAKAGFVTIDREDAFDQWCDMRDAMQAASVSRNHVNTRMAGYSDLDRYGTWVDVPEYGTVWRPTVKVANWAPYREGRWVWYDSCGWTWVSYEPWGWAPYHYGRWVHVNRYDWCWVPHHEVVHVVRHYPRPVWYPALVSFTYARHGSAFHFSVGGGYYSGPCVGWFALGPRDPFVPWHHRHHNMYARYHDGPPRNDRGRNNRHSPQRGDNIVVNNTTVNNNITIYQNQDAPNAVTVTTEREFASGTQENRAIATLDTKQRGNEVSVGTAAVQQMEEKRILDTRPSRNTGAGGNTTTTAKSNADRNVSPARAERTSAASPQRGTAPERTTTAASTAGNAPRAQTSESRRNGSDGTANVSPLRNTNDTSAREARTAVQTRETNAARTSEPRTSGRTPLIQDRSAAKNSEPARTTSKTTSNARKPIVNPNRTTTTSPMRSISPERSSRIETNSAERQPLIQERPETRTSATRNSESSRIITNPARESQSSVRPSTTNSSNTSSYSPARSYSQPRTSSQSAERQSYNPAQSYSTPRTYTSPSNSRSYSPGRSTNESSERSSVPQTYSTPQTYSAPRSYSAPQNNDAQSYSAPRTSAPSTRGSSTTSPSRSSGSRSTSPSRTSSRR